MVVFQFMKVTHPVEAPAGILPKISINLLDALAPVLSLSKLLAALRDIFVRNYGIQEVVVKLRELTGPSETGRVAIGGEIVKHHGHTGQHLRQHKPGHLRSHTNPASPKPTNPERTGTRPDRGCSVHQRPVSRESEHKI